MNGGGLRSRPGQASALHGAVANGGSVWESNPPTRVLAGLHGFEDRRGHQTPSAPIGIRPECGVAALVQGTPPNGKLPTGVAGVNLPVGGPEREAPTPLSSPHPGTLPSTIENERPWKAR